jgi:ectoine hydroxylase-related dioxygenase (phytanoyl-CoA dioxygenase family)
VTSGSVRVDDTGGGAVAVPEDPVTDSVVPEVVDEARAVDVQLAPGEFFLFSERLLHGSRENRTSQTRLGLTIRLIRPSVRVDHSRLLAGAHRCILVRGEDRHRVNRLQAPPVATAGRRDA